MEAALCLGNAYGPSPGISLRIPSTTLTSPASTKLGYVGLFSHRSRRRHHLYSTRCPALAIECRSNNSRPSSSGKEKGSGSNRVVGAATVGASLALACALSIIGCSCSHKMKLKAIAGPKPHYQKAPSFQQMAPVAPRKAALKSLLDVTVNLASRDGRIRRDVSPGPASRQLSTPSTSTSTSRDPVSIDQLKKEAVSLMKNGQPDEALFMLKNEHNKYKLSDPHTAFSMNMLLVEILICQGKYAEAYNYMSNDQSISEFEVRPTLYKAIVCTMLDREEEAQELWDKFANSIGGFSPYS